MGRGECRGLGGRRGGGEGSRIGCNSGGVGHGIWLLLCLEILNDSHTNQLQTELCVERTRRMLRAEQFAIARTFDT